MALTNLHVDYKVDYATDLKVLFRKKKISLYMIVETLPHMQILMLTMMAMVILLLVMVMIFL